MAAPLQSRPNLRIFWVCEPVSLQLEWMLPVAPTASL